MGYECMLSTKDNPFNPFDDFLAWWLYDTEKGYDSCGRLMRIAQLKDGMSQPEIDAELERAIDAILKYDVTNTYTKVIRNATES